VTKNPSQRSVYIKEDAWQIGMEIAARRKTAISRLITEWIYKEAGVFSPPPKKIKESGLPRPAEDDDPFSL